MIGQLAKRATRACSTIPISNAPGWREDLAAPFGADVKAGRVSTSMNEMHQKTVESAQAPSGERTHASYAREEVDGPLGHAGVGELHGVVGKDDLGPDAQVEPDGRVVSREGKHTTSTLNVKSTVVVPS